MKLCTDWIGLNRESRKLVACRFKLFSVDNLVGNKEKYKTHVVLFYQRPRPDVQLTGICYIEMH